MNASIPVWKTRSPERNRNDSYSYRFRYGSRPDKTSCKVGEFEQGTNPETGKPSSYTYSGKSGGHGEPSYAQIERMDSSINKTG